MDLLVPADRHDAAGAALARLGYRDVLAGLRTSERPPHATTWSREGLDIDLHRCLTLLPGDPYADLADGASTIDVGSVEVRVPRPAALTVVVALHAAKHGPSHARSLEDLRRAVVAGGDSTWHDAAALAERLGIVGVVASALAMVDGGAALASRRGLSGTVDPAVRLRLAGCPPLALRLRELWRTRDLRALADAILPSPAFMRYQHPLARRGPLGLAATYLMRPLRGIVLVSGAARHLAGVGARTRRSGRLIRGAAWAVRAVHVCRRQLRAGPLDGVRVPEAPPARRGCARGVRWGLAAARPSCLERSLVRRAWHLAQGRDRRIVIAVSGPGEPFGAHAWLEGDRDGADMVEMLRWPAA